MGYGLIDTVFGLFVSFDCAPRSGLRGRRAAVKTVLTAGQLVSFSNFHISFFCTTDPYFQLSIPLHTYPIMATSWLESIQGKSFQDVTIDDNQNINTEEFIRAAKSLVTLFGKYFSYSCQRSCWVFSSNLLVLPFRAYRRYCLEPGQG